MSKWTAEQRRKFTRTMEIRRKVKNPEVISSEPIKEIVETIAPEHIVYRGVVYRRDHSLKVVRD
jgi:hypothetical protein